MLKKTDYKCTLYVNYHCEFWPDQLGVPSCNDEELQSVFKLAEEGRVNLVRVSSHDKSVDLGKTIDALRKSPGGIKSLIFDDPIAESDFFEILKIVAHHDYT